MASSEKHILGYLFLVTIAITAIIYYYHLEVDLKVLGAGVLIGIFYTLLPDIDLPSSKLRKVIEKLSLAAILCFLIAYLYLENITLVYLSLALTLLLYLLWFSKHRKIFHSVAAGIFLSLPWYLLNPCFPLFAFSGFLTHLLIDGKLWKK